MLICNCGRETADKDSICAICRLDSNNPELQEAVKDIMSNKAKIKISDNIFCKACKNRIENPTSNNQKYHDECKPTIDKYRHRKCKAEGCMNQAVKNGYCKSDQHLINIPQNPTIPHEIPKSNGTHDLIESLIRKRDNYLQKAETIDSAIKVIEEEIEHNSV